MKFIAFLILTIFLHTLFLYINVKVPSEDIAKLVGEERKYDLLVMGLQEAPGNNICKLLKKTLDDTHMYVYFLLFFG